MKLRFYNAKILTMCPGEEIFEGELLVENGKIIDISKIAFSDGGYDREIDCRGKLIMPGFKNAHTHSAMTALRSYADDMPLSSWLNTCVFPFEAKMTHEDIYSLSKLAILEYLTSGITACMEMYLAPYAVARAFEDMGVRCVQVSSINNFSQSFDDMEVFCREIKSEYNSFFPGFHAEYTTSRELLNRIACLAAKTASPVFSHNAETRFEVEDCRKRNGMTPTALFDSLGLYENGGGGYHCVFFDEGDIEIFRRKGLCVVSCPASNLKLASGIAPLSKYSSAGIKIALGTDGPASNNCLDMFREMFLASTLSKVLENDASSMDAGEVLKMATVSGAEAMRLYDCDVLAVGKKADFAVIDLEQPNMKPQNNIVKNLVYSGSKANVAMTVVNGKILYENGSFALADAEKIYYEAEKIVSRIRGEMNGG